MNVSTHFTKYGPKGVPKGFVETQKLVKGNTPCLEVEVSMPFVNSGTTNSPSNLTDHASRANQNGQKVTKGTQKNEEVEYVGSSLASSEQLGEENGGGDLAGLSKLLLGHNGEVSNVAKHVKDSHSEQRNSAVSLESGDGVLDLVDDVEGIPVSGVGKDNADECTSQIITIGCFTIESIAEVGLGIGNSVDISTKDDKAGDTDAITCC